MNRLPVPLKDALQDPFEEADLQRMWRGVERRRLGEPPVTEGRRAWTGLALAGAVAAAVLLVTVGRGLTSPGDPGPLRLEGGAVVGTLERAPRAGSPRTEGLSDGSRITLAPGTRLESLENDGRAFVALLAAGRADFEVRPGGPRRWTVECGAASVEVVGTGFTVERSPARVRVDVRHGVVLVRGERVPERVRRLTRGGSLVLELAPSERALARTSPGSQPSALEARAPSEPGTSVVGPVAPSPEATPTRRAVAPRGNRTAWRALAERGRFGEAYETLGPEGLAREARGASAADLLRLADVARLSGHPEGAVGPLTEVLARHRGDPSASLAAFTLGRVELDGLRRPGRAAEAFSQALSLGAPRGLQEDAWARLAEARARAGDRAGARAAGEEYLRRFPEGARAASVRRWME